MTANLTWVPFPDLGLSGGDQSVEYRVLGITPWTIHSNVSAVTNSAIITGLNSNEIYEFRVVSKCGYGNPVSSDIKEKIEFTCPVVAIVDTTPTTVQYSFTHLGGSIDRYDVDILDSGNSVVDSNVHTSPSGTITGTFTGLSAATTYTIRVKPRATGNLSTYYKNDCSTWSSDTIPFSTHWATNTYVCEQESVLTLDSQFTNFSSPAAIYYDSTAARMYVGDYDNAAGNVYKFNPVGFAGIGSVTTIAGFASMSYNVKVDEQYERIYFVGINTSGLVSFDIPTETFTTIPFGTNGVLFNRTTINIVGSRIFVQDTGDGTITIIDRATLGILSTFAKTSVPSHSLYLNAYFMTEVNGEIWVTSAYNPSGNIGVYNTTLTTLNSTITLPGVLGEGSGFRQSVFYDDVNDKVYVGDAGSSKLFVIDGATKVVQHTKTFTNNEGKAYMLSGVNKDPITGDLYLNVQGYDSTSDVSKTNRFYKLSALTYDLEVMYPTTSFSNVAQQGTTNAVWSVDSGLPQWEGGAWATDGKILKYTR